MTSNKIDTLIKFLSLYNADKEYINAIKDKYGEDWEKYLTRTTVEYAISGTFEWDKYRRKEGETQWYNLDEKWKRLLNGKVFIETKESITLFNRKYEVAKGYKGYYLSNLSGYDNDLCFADAGISKDKYTNDNGGVFPYQDTLEDLQQIIYDMLGINKYKPYEGLNPQYEHYDIKYAGMSIDTTEEDCTKSKKIFTLYKPTIKNYYL